jgi:hypothetical protein
VLCAPCHEKHKENANHLYASRKGQGLCSGCGAESKKRLCAECKKRQRKNATAHYVRCKKAKRCFMCGAKASKKLTALCWPCYEDRRPHRETWRKEKREHINAYMRKRAEDIQIKIANRLRSRFYYAMRDYKAGTRKKSSVKDLGCTLEQLCTHLESKFQPGMSWVNYGRWHIDHVKPLAAFDLTDEEQQRQACHFSNLQPLWAKDNLSKGCRIDN